MRRVSDTVSEAFRSSKFLNVKGISSMFNQKYLPQELVRLLDSCSNDEQRREAAASYVMGEYENILLRREEKAEAKKAEAEKQAESFIPALFFAATNGIPSDNKEAILAWGKKNIQAGYVFMAKRNGKLERVRFVNEYRATYFNGRRRFNFVNLETNRDITLKSLQKLVLFLGMQK